MKLSFSISKISVFLALLIFISCSKDNTTSSTGVAKTWDNSPIESFMSGSYDYDFQGTSFSTTEISCDDLKTKQIKITIPQTATVKKAYIFWATSGTNDQTITVDGNAVTGPNSTLTNNYPSQKWYKNYSDITSIVQAKRTGSYTVTDLNFMSGNPYCSVLASLGVASILVVYEDQSLPKTDVHVYHPGLQSFDYIDKNIAQNLRIPSSNLCNSACDVCKPQMTITCCWGEGDSYKTEQCSLWTHQCDANSLSGSTAPNLDIDTYKFSSTPTDGIFPIKFKGYLQWSRYGRAYEGMMLKCCVIKVECVGSKGKVCSCLKDENGVALANKTFTIKNANGQLVTVTTDANGNWCQELPEGNYEVLPNTGFTLATPVNFSIEKCKCITLPCVVFKPVGGGCPDADNDTVCDNVDACPNEAGDPANDGCPQLFDSQGDILYSSKFVAFEKSTTSPTLTMITSAPTAADLTNLTQYYRLYAENFAPTAGSTFVIKGVKLQNLGTYGSMISKTYNIAMNVTVVSFNATTKYIKLRYTGTFEEQGLSNTRTFNVNGNVVGKYLL